MIKHKWIVGVINTLRKIAAEMNSAAAIEGAKMTNSEREYFNRKLTEIADELYKKIYM